MFWAATWAVSMSDGINNVAATAAETKTLRIFASLHLMGNWSGRSTRISGGYLQASSAGSATKSQQEKSAFFARSDFRSQNLFR
jgi:hypothetical protein